jgi:hypothetical protein
MQLCAFRLLGEINSEAIRNDQMISAQERRKSVGGPKTKSLSAGTTASLSDETQHGWNWQIGSSEATVCTGSIEIGLVEATRGQSRLQPCRLS